MAAAHMQQFTQKRTTVIEKVNKKTRKIKKKKTRRQIKKKAEREIKMKIKASKGGQSITIMKKDEK